jgi:predicted enzyme related to lactoylglutathione lyase
MAVLNVDESGRQNVGRVDHVVYRYPSRQARDAARDDFRAKFGFETWMDVGTVETAGVDAIVGCDCGLELLSPSDSLDGDPSERGAFSAVVFGVADLDAAVERAKAHGARTIPIPLPEPVKEIMACRFAVVREAMIPLDDLGGVRIILGEFAPLPGQETVKVDDRGRLHPGALDHIVFAFADLSLVERAVARVRAVLGVEDWLDLGVIEPGALRVFIAPEAGLEFICPAAPGSFLDSHIARNGPASFFGQVISVADFDAGVERVGKAGGAAHERPVHPVMLQRVSSARHAAIGRVGSIPTTLSEVVTPR